MRTRLVLLSVALPLAVLWLASSSSIAQSGGDTTPPSKAALNKLERATATLTGGTITVYVHVITDGSAGDVTDYQIATQILALNNDFAAGTGWQFVLGGIDRTANAAWFTMTPGSAAEAQAKGALRQGGAADLNLYTANPGIVSLGFASWPWDYAAAPLLDGIVVPFSLVPGGNNDPHNNEGDVAAHLVGHWLGVLHTSESGCSGKGDYVNDTPAEQSPAFGCPFTRDTCKAGGVDPISNFMDSTDDSCRDSFTAGQADLMNRAFSNYRNGN